MRILSVLMLAAAALGAQAPSTPALATKIDATGDTIFARVNGTVPAARIHRLVQELSIAPGADDTTLFTRVTNFKVDGSGRYWVFDQGSKSFFIFNSDGKLAKRFGRNGSGPGEFNDDNGTVVLPGDRIAVWDARNGRISWFAKDGTFEKSVVISKGFYTFNGLRTDRSGSLFITLPVRPPGEATIGRIGLVRVKPDGTYGDSLLPPDFKVSVPSWTAASGGSRASYSSRNSAGTQWVIHPDGYFVTVDGSRSRVVLSRKEGKPVVIERSLPLVPIPADERADDKDFITWGLRQNVPDWQWSGADVPATKPTLYTVFAARDGRLWIRVATPSERIPDAELPERRPNGAPPQRFRSSNEYEVYASDGTFLARVLLPAKTQLMQADGNTLWALGANEDDLPAVRRYRIEPPLPRGRP